MMKLSPFTPTVLLSQSLVNNQFLNVLRNKCDVCVLGKVEEHMFNESSFYSLKIFRVHHKNVCFQNRASSGGDCALLF
ncbi:unnamed protein product [Angiostrongylus costaricensis]|uniref:Gag-pol polyprotein n=1 Tax=Angiostrongylus costaricensis TaxID=334426 RepID=A0A0R3PTT3_ANGCS|nr:unnamed protein product [Angiostrongylus costaricensis]